MFSDLMGPVRVKNNTSDGIQEISFQFLEGQAFGYRDVASKYTFFKSVYPNDMLKRDKLDFRNKYQGSFESFYDFFNIKL